MFIQVNLWTPLLFQTFCLKIIEYARNGSLGIATTRNCTHFLKIGFMVAGGGFYSYHIHQWNKSDKERKIVRTKLSFIHTKRFSTFFKRWMKFRLGAIPRLPPETITNIPFFVNYNFINLIMIIKMNWINNFKEFLKIWMICRRNI